MGVKAGTSFIHSQAHEHPLRPGSGLGTGTWGREGPAAQGKRDPCLCPHPVSQPMAVQT